MGGKDKKNKEEEQDHDEDCSHDDDDNLEEDEVDIEEEVENKIKELPTLKEKVQAIAINGYLIEKRKLDKAL